MIGGERVERGKMIDYRYIHIKYPNYLLNKMKITQYQIENERQEDGNKACGTRINRIIEFI